MRTIAATSGAKVTGLTINDYQVSRAKYHNEKVRQSGGCRLLPAHMLRRRLGAEPETALTYAAAASPRHCCCFTMSAGIRSMPLLQLACN